jgi:hypothetical protein
MHYHACEAYCPEVLPSGQVARSSRDLNLCCEFGKLRNRTRRGVQLGLGEVIRPSRQDSEELNHVFRGGRQARGAMGPYTGVVLLRGTR